MRDIRTVDYGLLEYIRAYVVEENQHFGGTCLTFDPKDGAVRYSRSLVSVHERTHHKLMKLQLVF
jgi:hypothetical protein